MQVGVIFPQTEIEPDPSAVRDFAQAAEDLGYSHIFIADHVLGADPSFHPERPAFATYNHKAVVHEAFTLMGFLAGVTSRVGLTTGILILPQRQTALVAKQAAEVDILSGGRLRLGIGVGWNDVEYEALGEDFGNRGRRSAEQIAVMRALWTQEVVDFHGRWHNITHAGINPLPVQRPIPIWLGGGEERVIQRIGKMADGWFPQFQPDSAGQEKLAQMREYATKAGRDPKDIGIEGRISYAADKQDTWE
ncbi:MAG: LLM class F420-dependent oxidoreductase, partial [Chloroflexi bacterium]|nr:LLM class F420-dependent oxidoreductase [Chloroflexota bacterium]